MSISAAQRFGAIILLTAGSAWPQIDLGGEWAATFHEDLQHRGGVRLGDYTGLPLNESGWRKAQSWDESARSTFERQCIPHVVTYAMRGPANIRFSKVVDPVSGELQAYSLLGSYGRPRTIWMDGREHPSPLAPHTWAGFSTGHWERNMLVVETTHIKTGWLLRNGAPTSDLATMTEYYTRYGNYLMLASFVNDPVYLDEPFIRTSNFVLSQTTSADAWGNCGPAQIIDELGGRPKGWVAHYLPGQTAHVQEFLTKSGVPAEGARGGGATTYPEYIAKLEKNDLDNRIFPPPTPGKSFPRVISPETTDPQGEISVLPVQGNLYMLSGAGANMAVQVGEDGVLLVDTGDGKASDKVIAAIRKLSNKPIRFIVDTSVDADHMGGNERLAALGKAPGGGRASDSGGPGAMVFAQEAVLAAVSAPSGQKAPLPVGAWPTESYPDWKELSLNNEAIQIFHVPAAHTDGDSLVFFRRSDVIVTGDIFGTNTFPVINKGGSINGVIDGLNRIIEITIPKDWQEGGTMVIPGHGRICDEADVVEYRDMVTIIRDRIQDSIKKGMTLDQVKTSRPTLEYDSRYGSDSGPWTTSMFIEAVYRSLAGK
ncbi:MAG TPA: MBL fold metallo-hydrolase [Bryobacteraceae bacterium]|nr:MBL fold metallo-hydrolase [Bryobacteraceae bacterium]